MRHTIRLLAVAAALARVASAEPFHDTESGLDGRALPLHAFEVAGHDVPAAEPEAARALSRQPGASADFAAMIRPAPRASLRPARTASLESENMLGFFSPAGVGGLFYFVAVVLGFYYRWLFQRTRERGRFVTQRPPEIEARRAA